MYINVLYTFIPQHLLGVTFHEWISRDCAMYQPLRIHCMVLDLLYHWPAETQQALTPLHGCPDDFIIVTGPAKGIWVQTTPSHATGQTSVLEQNIFIL